MKAKSSSYAVDFHPSAHIEAEARRLNERRHGVALRVVLEMLGVVLAGAGLVALLLVAAGPIAAGLGGGLVLLATIFACIYRYGACTASYRGDYKHALILHRLQQLDAQPLYEHGRGIGSELFVTSMLYPHAGPPELYTSEDLVIVRTPEHGGVAFSEVRTEYRSGQHTYPYFKGLFGCTTIEERVDDVVVVKSNQHAAKYGVWHGFSKYTFDRFVNEFGAMHPALLRDDDFEAHFTAYAMENTGNAKKLLKPEVRHALLELRRELGHEIEISIGHGLLFFAIPAKRNLFDPPLFRTLDAAYVQRDIAVLDAAAEIATRLTFTPRLKEGETDAVADMLDGAVPSSQAPRLAG